MCPTRLAPTGGITPGLVPSRSQPSAERLTRPEQHALSSLPFYTAAGWRGNRRPGWAPTVLPSQDEECLCVCASVCEAEVREVPLACVLWAFSCFLLWSSLSSLHPTRSLRLRLLVCSTPTLGLERGCVCVVVVVGGWGVDCLTETPLVLSVQGRGIHGV